MELILFDCGCHFTLLHQCFRLVVHGLLPLLCSVSWKQCSGDTMTIHLTLSQNLNNIDRKHQPFGSSTSVRRHSSPRSFLFDPCVILFVVFLLLFCMNTAKETFFPSDSSCRGTEGKYCNSPWDIWGSNVYGICYPIHAGNCAKLAFGSARNM